MTRTVYEDFDEFADSFDGCSGRYVPTQRSTSEWWVDHVNVGRVGVSRVQIGGGATFAGAGDPRILSVGIPATDPTEIRVNGHSLEENSLFVLNRGQSFTSSARNLSRWMGMAIPLDHPELGAEVQEAALRTDFNMEDTRARSEKPHIVRLSLLVSRMCTDGEGVEFLHPAATTAAESEAVACVASALLASSRSPDRHVGRPQFSRARVIARALGLIEASHGQPLFIEDLCRATEVSERTLRNIFQEYFGVGPMRLLKVRQLREIRAALLEADGTHDTVTRVASRFGVWDFSLFARNYKALYGESPSETLRKRTLGADVKRDLSWVGCASRIFVDETPSAPMLPQAVVS
jgi:AraC family ethanolamine operon transcriptional activator